MLEFILFTASNGQANYRMETPFGTPFSIYQMDIIFVILPLWEL